MAEMNSEKPHTYLTSSVVARNLCTSRSRVFLEHTTTARSISKFPVYYKTGKINFVFRRTRHKFSRQINPVLTSCSIKIRLHVIFKPTFRHLKRFTSFAFFSGCSLHVSQTHVLQSTVLICTRSMQLSSYRRR